MWPLSLLTRKQPPMRFMPRFTMRGQMSYVQLIVTASTDGLCVQWARNWTCSPKTFARSTMTTSSIRTLNPLSAPPFPFPLLFPISRPVV